MIKLPSIRADAYRFLARHDKEVRRMFTQYAITYAEQYGHELGTDDSLPLSGIRYPTKSKGATSSIPLLRTTSESPIVRSHFIALSGHTDRFASIEELSRTIRSGIHLNKYAIPDMSRYIAHDDGEHTLNSYLLDFFIHGQVQTLERANGIRQSDVWYYLQDFMLTLLTVKASLEQYLVQVSRSAVDDESITAVESGMDDDDDVGVKADNFTRPEGVTDADWRVYAMVRDASSKFDEKYRNMWA